MTMEPETPPAGGGNHGESEVDIFGRDGKFTPGQWLIQQIDEIFADVTEEEWAEWPETDASEQLDHYLYGSPKRETRKFKSDAVAPAKMPVEAQHDDP